jgi:nucleotide-binding universal stress UspA family protein
MRTIICVVDNSPEQQAAILYACSLAKTAKHEVALLYVLEPLQFQQWGGVEEIARTEQRREAERALGGLSIMVEGLLGERPYHYIRFGALQEEVLATLREEQDICHLVLAAASNPDNPGKLVTTLGGKAAGQLRVPLTIVPANYTFNA